jgi:SpoVK/Ycf46/Vps4 family AAA+-type ATPase
VTALFAGPPGVGKTLAAEAIAAELGRPILTVTYAQIQNKWVGETEKNIVRVFREAAETAAVLFWDEADAMFYDRDSADRNWEVRDVNVLLQELERFEGVCILATNRKASLDRALERRISLKIEFERPDAELRRKIWRRLIPARLPIAEDVDFDAFAQRDLTGGEIKNIVLNASRLAMVRSPSDRVTNADFERAIEMETNGRWGSNRRRRLGFTEGS